MNLISIFGYICAIVGIIFLISNSMNYTHINYFWVIISLLLGFCIAYIGGQVE